MANAIYPLWKQALMRDIDTEKSLDAGVFDVSRAVSASLVTIEGGYTYSDAHQFYTDVTNVVIGPVVLNAPAVNGRIFSGQTLVYTNVTGTKIGAVVLVRKNPGAASTWRLVLYEDTGIVGMPLIPSGGNVIVTWNVQGIFGL